MFAFIGSQTKGGTFNGSGEGLYALNLDAETGAGTQIDLVRLQDPTYLAVSRNRRVVYASSHSVTFEGAPGSGITSFSVRPDGRLERLNAQRVPHPHVTMIATDASDRFLLAASSLGGAVSLLPIEADGRLSPVSDTAQFEGKVTIAVGETPEPKPVPGMPGVTITRMPEFGLCTYPHSVRVLGDWVIVADLGVSAIGILRLDATARRFTQKRRFPLQRKAGPRIIELHPNGRTFFCINEFDSTVSVYNLDHANGSVEEVQYLSALPADALGKTSGGGIAIHPSGEWLWVTNRGHDSISTFKIDSRGLLEFRGCIPSRGQFPNHLAVTPDGRRLYASNTKGPNLAAFDIGHEGSLIAAGLTEIPATCAVFLP